MCLLSQELQRNFLVTNPMCIPHYLRYYCVDFYYSDFRPVCSSMSQVTFYRIQRSSIMAHAWLFSWNPNRTLYEITKFYSSFRKRRLARVHNTHTMDACFILWNNAVWHTYTQTHTAMKWNETTHTRLAAKWENNISENCLGLVFLCTHWFTWFVIFTATRSR